MKLFSQKLSARFSVFDQSIVGLSLLIAAASSFVLINSNKFLKVEPENSSLERIGKFSRSFHDVRRKYDGDILWSGVSESDVVYQFDTLYTGKESKAELSISEKSSVTIEPESLISLEMKDKKLNLNLSSGSISGVFSKEEEIKLTMHGKSFNLKSKKGSSFVIRSDKSGKSDFQVKTGEIEIETKGKTVEIKKDEKVEVSKVGNVSEVIHASIEQVSPKNGIFYYKEVNPSVEFDWKAIGEVKNAKIQISRDSEFKVIELELESSLAQKGSLSLDGLKGRYFWRVIAKDSAALKKIESFNSEFVVGSTTEVFSNYPQSGAKLSQLRNEKNLKQSVPFHWTSSYQSSDQEIEVSSDVEFRDPIVTRKVSSHKASLELGVGKYFWRVRPIERSAGVLPWSRPMEFDIVEETIGTQAELILPENKKVIVFKSKDEKIDLKWDFKGNSKKFSVQVSRQPDFKESVFDDVVTEKELALPVTDFGKYYWRVKATTAEGFLSEFSNTREFEIRTKPRLSKVELKTLAYEKEISSAQLNRAPAGVSNELVVEWNAVKDARAYQVELSQDSNFEINDKYVVKSSDFRWMPKKYGFYYLKVSAIDTEGELGVSSSVAELKIKLKPEEPLPIVEDEVAFEDEPFDDSTDEFGYLLAAEPVDPPEVDETEFEVKPEIKPVIKVVEKVIPSPVPDRAPASVGEKSISEEPLPGSTPASSGLKGITFGTGITQFSVSDGKLSYGSLLSTVDAELEVKLKNSWNLGLQVDYSWFNISQSASFTSPTKLSVLSGLAEMSKVLWKLGNKFEVSPLFGLSYQTILGTSQVFTYADMLGPIAGARADYRRGEKHSAHAVVRIGSLPVTGNVISTSNIRFETGIFYSRQTTTIVPLLSIGLTYRSVSLIDTVTIRSSEVGGALKLSW